MKKIFVILTILSVAITLTGCDISNLFNFSKTENTLNIFNETIYSSGDNYIFEFELEEKNYKENGTVDTTIKADYRTLYTNEFSFSPELLQVSVKILKEEIKLSSNETGEFRFTIIIDNLTCSSVLSINKLTVGDIELITLEEIIDNSSSTIARNNIEANEWANHSDDDVDNMLLCYDQLKEKIKQYILRGPNINDDCKFLELVIYEYSLTRNQAYEVYCAVSYDCPIYYFGDGLSLNFYSNDENVYSIVLYSESIYNDKDVRDEYNEMIIEYFYDCIDLVENAQNDLEISLLLHDKIIEEIDYDYDFDVSCFNILGVIASEGAVCEAYSETYFMLLNYFDIGCYLAIGIGGSNGNYEKHSWNIIEINNDWYFVDVSWNDLGSKGTIYDYFCVGSNNTKYKTTHVVDASGLTIDSGLSYMVDLPDVSTIDLVYNWK